MSTLEAVLRVDSSTAGLAVDGAKLRAGTDLDLYRVIKVEESEAGQSVTPGRTNGEPVRAKKITAVLDATQALMWSQPRAVVKYRVGMAECWKSCGMTSRVASDVPMERFTVFRGGSATPGLAMLMAQEFATPVWKDGQVSFVRVPDLFSALPVDVLAADVTEKVLSSWLEHDASVTAYSLKPDGSVLLGNPSGEARRPVFIPHAPVRVLNNLTRCLMLRRTLPGSYAPKRRAGDVVTLGSEKAVVVTAAHQWVNSGAGVPGEQSTTLFLGQIRGLQ